MGRENGEKVQDALYRIAELASAAQDMQEFYRAIHGVVGELMHAESFYIALYDEERRLIGWPYYVDDVDPEIPDPNHWDAFGATFIFVRFCSVHFTVRFDGQTALGWEDATFKEAGNVGVWTKADSVTLFDDFSFGGK